MSAERIGVLHPGEMGASVAAALQAAGHRVSWASAGRSAQTAERAARIRLEDVVTLQQLAADCSVIVSVCPPHAAEEVAGQVLACGFRGLYLDANAIAPQRVIGIAERMTAAGVTFVDGSIIGPPAWQPGTTWLHLSGQGAARMAESFAGSPMQTVVLGEEPGAASALKMCYAAYTKGTTALLAAILAASEALGVREALYAQWQADGSGLDRTAPDRARRSTAKAWRFVGEMEEIAATFAAAGLPDGFHLAAVEVYRRLAPLRPTGSPPPLEDVLAALLKVTG
jgi:3-hydroxyisobutyrate dehydrogenase-like beta-hydroxyacid dehydrogenase